MKRNVFNQYLSESNFRELFITEMGWNNPSGATLLPEYTIDERTFQIEQIAERSGFQILQCKVDEIPVSSICKKLDTKLRKNAENYICIFVVPATMHHLWVAPVKKVEKRDLVLVEYDTVDKASFLFEKMEGLSFSLDDEAPTILDIIEKVQAAFLINSEKITKDFYAGFKKEHTNFAKFITGIDDHLADKDNKNKQWYTSVMLNRLMFCYFIQKKGFLDGDVDYLRHKLEWTQENEGEDRFFNKFYKGFLVSLFHDGLNAPHHDQAFESVYGRIPYLNGGMFDVHQIEQDYAGLDIADEAFRSLFDFFDKWHWHLDDRMTATGRDINPDVLGYIFEQYINDRAQMGAYYTKEDITEYIGRNTIIPYLMDAVKQKDEKLFKANGELWQFLRDSGDRYIFDAVKKGHDQPIPEEIAVGIDTTQPNLLERRSHWNERTPDALALPTEIWRETIERLQRYRSIKAKIENGEITAILTSGSLPTTIYLIRRTTCLWSISTMPCSVSPSSTPLAALVHFSLLPSTSLNRFMRCASPVCRSSTRRTSTFSPVSCRRYKTNTAPISSTSSTRASSCATSMVLTSWSRPPRLPNSACS